MPADDDPPDYCADAAPRPYWDGERHSPGVLRRILGSAGHAPPRGWHAHHIVAGNEPWADAARETLRRCKISINDCENGVFLPGARDAERSSEHPNAAIHLELTEAYDRAVSDALREVACSRVREILRRIRECLLQGGFPCPTPFNH